MKNVISCSRRTDIPALYYDWLQERLTEKKVTLTNPYNNEPYDVDLSPSNVHSIVLWSKNFTNVLKDPGLLKLYNLYFQFTINGYSKNIEPNILNSFCETSTCETIDQLEKLCKQYSPKQINWRFDPILFSQYSSWEERLKMFNFLSKEAHKNGIERCTFSFISIYGKVRESLDSKEIKCEEVPDEKKIEFAKEMVKIATVHDIKLYSCCEAVVENVDGINKGHCVDGGLLTNLFGDNASKSIDQGQRLTCGCTKSKDIGSYAQRCSHKCVYCYANPSAYTSVS